MARLLIILITRSVGQVAICWPSAGSCIGQQRVSLLLTVVGWGHGQWLWWYALIWFDWTSGKYLFNYCLSVPVCVFSTHVVAVFYLKICQDKKEDEPLSNSSNNTGVTFSSMIWNKMFSLKNWVGHIYDLDMIPSV
jgi:hypothetical protein